MSLTKLGNLQNLGEYERWQLYEAFEQLQFKQQNKILYEGIEFKSSNADVNDDQLTEEIADKPSRCIIQELKIELPS
jgi:hypothetical protein